MVKVENYFEEIASFELPYSDKEQAFPFIEVIGDMARYLSSEGSLKNANFYHSLKLKSYDYDKLYYISTTKVEAKENVLGETVYEKSTDYYFNPKLSDQNYFNRHDLANLSKACSKMIKDGVTNSEIEYTELKLKYSCVSNTYIGPMTELYLSTDKDHAVVRLDAKEDDLKVSCLASPSLVDKDDLNLFLETLSYAHHKGVPITFNHSGLEKKSSEHEKSYHAQFKSYRFNQYKKLDHFLDNAGDSIGSFFSGLYKKGKDWLKH